MKIMIPLDTKKEQTILHSCAEIFKINRRIEYHRYEKNDKKEIVRLL